MLMKRIASLALVWSLLSVANAGTEELVSVGKFKAHDTRILAKYKDGSSVESTRATLQSLGLKVSRQYDLVSGLVLIDSSLGQVSRAGLSAEERSRNLLNKIQVLRDSGNFAYVDPDYAHYPTAEPTDAKYIDGTLWALRNSGQNGGVDGADINVSRPGLGGTNAWDISVGSSDVVVAVIDTGVRYTHRDLVTQMWVNPGEIAGNGADEDGNGYIDDVHGLNAILDSGDPFDDHDHGTHVAGTIAAAANDDNGHVGIAWKVKIMALKFIRNAEQGGYGLTSDAIQCLQYAVSKGVKLSNNSWGGGPFEQTLFDAIQQARDKGHLFVAAAGNDSSDTDLDPAFPADYELDNVISVAAIDRKDKLASFSNFGRNTVDLGAPGVEIYSSTSGSDTEYQVFAGTSMASPHVTGVAALCLSANPKASVLELRERLLSTVSPVESLKGRTVTGGRLNALAALQATADGVLEVSVTPAPGTSSQPAELLAGSKTLFTVRVTDLLSVTNAKFSSYLINGVATTNLSIANDGKAPDLVSNDAVYTGYLFVPTNLGPLELVYDVNAAGKKKLTVTNLYSVVPGPANDHMTNALKIAASGGTVLGNNKFGTLELKEPMHSGNPSVASSVWWDWSPKVSGPVVVDTTGTAFDSVVGVYTGVSIPSLKLVASADDVGTRKQGYVNFNATAGQTYHIAVAGFDTNSVGVIRVRVELNGAADTSIPAVVIGSPASGLITDKATLVVNGTAVDPSPNSSGLQKVTLRVNNNLAVDASGTSNWGQSVTLQRGLNTISAIAIDQAGNASLASTITVTYRPDDVPNDLFARASVLSGVKGSASATSIGATKEFGEPNHGGNDGGHSVWWAWTAPTNGVLTLSTQDSAFDTLLGVYSGNFVDRLTVVGGNDDAVDGSGYSSLSQAVQSGVTYHIAVDGFGGRTGNVKLSYSFETQALAAITVSAGEGGTVSPAGGYFAVGSVQKFTAVGNPGYEFVRWDGDVTSYDPVQTITVRSDLKIRAVFQKHKPTEDFESGGLTGLGWSTSGDSLWTVVSENPSSGKYVVKSGKIGNSQSSKLILNANTRSGTGSFDLQVSSEAGWDQLKFFIDGIEQKSWSGELAWQTYKFSVAAGTHTFEWVYSKDANNSFGSDSAAIDNLELPLVVAPDASARGVLSINRKATGSAVLTVIGQVNQLYVLEVSKDLLRWTELTRGIAANGVLVVEDPTSVAEPMRFYRAVVRP